MNTSPPRFDTPLDVRLACRRDALSVFPSTTIDGFLAVNLVMMDRDHAGEFETFCERNPRACPLIAMTEPGQPFAPATLAADCDLRTDLRSYDVLRDGRNTGSVPEVAGLFNERIVSFLIGSSVSFDGLLAQRGWRAGFGPCIYLTTVECEPVGPFRGPLAVTMRSFPPAIADEVAEFTSHFPRCHGGPICRDRPDELGILDERDQLLPWPGWVPAGEEKLYWACGITPSRVAIAARLPLMIVHTPGNALVTDIPTMSLYEEDVSGSG